MSQPESTGFAPAQRASEDEIRRQFGLLSGLGCSLLLDALPGVVLVLNEQRQLVFANQALLDLLGVEDMVSILGRRPGELFDCVHVANGAGCGTTEFCRHCGAVKAILSSIAGTGAEQECRMTRNTGNGVESQDLAVSCRPVEVGGARFNVFSLQDISNEKRRKALERVFFHDILNLAGSLKNLVKVFGNRLPEDAGDVGRLLQTGFDHMVDEILSQRELVWAERGELQVALRLEDSLSVLEELVLFYGSGELAEGKQVVMDEQACRVRFCTDVALLRRVLGNMLKNGLEASEPGQTVLLGCDLAEGRIRLWVRNEAAMPEDVRQQVFKRSFSTKGEGRGLGTYSMRLFGERYLGGEVSFASEPGKGTTFTLELPLRGC